MIERLQVRIPAGAAGEFSSPEATLCAACHRCLFQIPETQWSQSGLTMPLSRHSVGTYQKRSSHSSGNTQWQSSQVAEPLWTDPGLKSGISVRELISTLKKNMQAGNKLSNILQKSSHMRKKPAAAASKFCVQHYFKCSMNQWLEISCFSHMA